MWGDIGENNTEWIISVYNWDINSVHIYNGLLQNYTNIYVPKNCKHVVSSGTK